MLDSCRVGVVLLCLSGKESPWRVFRFFELSTLLFSANQSSRQTVLKGACGSLRLAFHELSAGGTSGSDSVCDPILRETHMPFSVVFCVVHGRGPSGGPNAVCFVANLHLVLWLTRLIRLRMASVWCQPLGSLHSHEHPTQPLF